MATGPNRLTYEDYLHFPEGERWEIIDGEAYLVPSPTADHQDAANQINYQILRHLKEHGGGRVFIAPFDVVLEDGDVVQPDVIFIADEDMDVLTRANVRGSPTWVVEVISDPLRDRNLKRQRYERAGIAEYWIVDPSAQTVEVYRLSDGAYGEPAVTRPPGAVRPLRPEGLEIDLGDVFRSP